MLPDDAPRAALSRAPKGGRRGGGKYQRVSTTEEGEQGGEAAPAAELELQEAGRAGLSVQAAPPPMTYGCVMSQKRAN